jgi:hypothetical protein
MRAVEAHVRVEDIEAVHRSTLGSSGSVRKAKEYTKVRKTRSGAAGVATAKFPEKLCGCWWAHAPTSEGQVSQSSQKIGCDSFSGRFFLYIYIEVHCVIYNVFLRSKRQQMALSKKNLPENAFEVRSAEVTSSTCKEWH